MSRASVVKLNDIEVEEVTKIFGGSSSSLEEFCRSYSTKFGWESVCVTQGAKGCALLMNNEYVAVPGYAVEVVDTVGAGDAFAAAFVHGYGNGWPARRIGEFANRVGALSREPPRSHSRVDLGRFANQSVNSGHRAEPLNTQSPIWTNESLSTA